MKNLKGHHQGACGLTFWNEKSKGAPPGGMWIDSLKWKNLKGHHQRACGLTRLEEISCWFLSLSVAERILKTSIQFLGNLSPPELFATSLSLSLSLFPSQPGVSLFYCLLEHSGCVEVLPWYLWTLNFTLALYWSSCGSWKKSPLWFSVTYNNGSPLIL